MPSHRYPRDLFGEIGIPDLGMDTDTVPRLMSPRKAQLVKNFLMDRPGILPMRGPICDAPLTTTDGIGGAWIFDDKILHTNVSPGATALREPWVAPYRKATAAGQLRRVGSSLLIDLAARTVTSVTAGTTDTFPGLSQIRIGNFVYGFGGDSSTTITQGGYVYLNTHFLRWDGTTAALTQYTNGPRAAQAIAYHYNRLVALSGVAPGGSVIQFNSLFWSDQLPTDGTALPDTAAAWQDDVSGLVNQLVVGSDDPNDFGVALAHVGSNLCIFKRRSMWMLYGNQPANFSVKQASNEVGCIDPRSVVEYNGGVYFMSERGFMFYDGSRVQNVSVGLNNSLVANAVKQCGQAGVDGGYVRAVYLGAGYIMVTTGRFNGVNATTAADSDPWLLYAPTGAWTQFSSNALTAIWGAGRTTNNTFLWASSLLSGLPCVQPINYVFAPQTAPAGTRGFDSSNGGATKLVIPSRWTTRALELSAPTSKSKLQRIMAEYYWGLANGGWTVTTTTRGATGAASQSSVLAAPSTVATNLPARSSIPVFNETDEVYLDIAATSSAPAAFNDAELHRLLVEYEPTGNTVPV